MSKFLDDLKQYYFDRDEFNEIFYNIFTDEEILQIELGCWEHLNLGEFLLYQEEDEFYIIHFRSGTIINWYKHLGRTNTCNKEGFSTDDLIEFLVLLKDNLSESIKK